jgi:perosamine synthetase
MNPEAPGTTNGYWMPTVVVNQGIPFDREALLAGFRAHNIDGRVFFWPLSMLPMFESRPENAVGYGLYERAVNLPSYHDLSVEEMDQVVTHIRRCLRNAPAATSSPKTDNATR